jgi:hypothetical protein
LKGFDFTFKQKPAMIQVPNTSWPKVFEEENDMFKESAHGLQEQLDAARWEWLREHHQRGVLLLVEPLLDLAEVGERMAADDSAAVQAWLASRLLAKPSETQVAAWDAMPDKLFALLIVSPFVLVQEQGTDATVECPVV